jgi:hypothetical protein
VPEEGSAWWSFKRLQDAAEGDFVSHTPRIREAWAKLEERIAVDRLEVETQARSASDPYTAAELLSDFMAHTLEAALAQCETLRASIASA